MKILCSNGGAGTAASQSAGCHFVADLIGVSIIVRITISPSGRGAVPRSYPKTISPSFYLAGWLYPPAVLFKLIQN